VPQRAPRSRARASALVLVGAALAFLAITLGAASGALLPADEAVLAWVAARRDCGGIAVATALSVVGAGEVSLLLTALLAAGCLVRRQPRAAAALLLLYVSLPIELGLKHTLAQPLPGVLYPIPGACEWYHPALSVTTPHSYPSGYAIRVTYFVAIAVVWLLRRPRSSWRNGWAARLRDPLLALSLGLILGLLLASRLVLSWHWPSDLVGGASLGVALGAATLLVALPSPAARG
jgi:membrane-associated phospholipid phosphatase